MITWPVGVNQIIRNESSGAGRNGITSDTMRSGKKKIRVQSTSAPKPLSIVMVFTRAEFQLFESWFEGSLRLGSLSFQFPKVAGTGNAEYIILPPYQWSQYGRDTLKVTMSWETA